MGWLAFDGLRASETLRCIFVMVAYLLALAIAVLLALLSLFPNVLGSARKSLGNLVDLALRPLKAIHTGRIGDFVAWFIFGIAAYGAILLLCTK